MSDSKIETFQPPPPPPPPAADALGPRPLHLRMPAVTVFVLGVLVLIGGIAKFIPGGILTGLAFVCWGVMSVCFQLHTTSSGSKRRRAADVRYAESDGNLLRAHPRVWKSESAPALAGRALGDRYSQCSLLRRLHASG